MKTKFLIAAAVAVAAYMSAAADTLKGKVSDGNGKPVEYATVVAIADSVQRGGTVTDSLGVYTMELPKGTYEIKLTSVGYEPADTIVTVSGTTVVNPVMRMSGVVMQEVEVTASAIRREPDRFVMMVEDMPAAIGKDGTEILRDAPGVWIDDDKISINGRSNPKIYVNDRELKMDNDQLQAFLKSLKAEDVSKIEVIPLSGAEYSADSASGIIKITMKRNRADGVMGNVAARAGAGKNMVNVAPSAALNVKKGKWSFNLNGQWDYHPKMIRDMEEDNDYANGTHYVTNTEINADKFHFGNVMAGLFFDPDKRNSFGLEFSFSNFKNPSRTSTDAVFDRIGFSESIAGRYITHATNRNYDVTFNYVNRLDTLGSTMKVIANYSRADNRQRMDNSQVTAVNAVSTDSISRSREHSIFDVVNLSYDFDKKFNQKWNLSAGAKYTMNRMDNDAFFEYEKNAAWRPETSRNYDYRYTENIYALYAKATGKFDKLSAVVGLRGEYTDASSRGDIVSQNYFDLFPNGYLTYSIDDAGANTLTLGYSRYISRPSFWALNPMRSQTSDYFYQSGNPELQPAYQNNFSLTAVYKYRYSMSLWVDMNVDPMMQSSVPDPQNPDNIIVSMVNADKVYNYGAAINLPFQFTKWWTLSVNPIYIRTGQRMQAGGDLEYSNMFFMPVNSGFQLPKNFYFNVSYFYQGKVRQGNMRIGSMGFLNASLKKTFADNRWTASVSANNILSSGIDLTLVSDQYTSVTKVDNPVSFNVSLTYNFNVGEMFRAKSIEKNADASRMQKESK